VEKQLASAVERAYQGIYQAIRARALRPGMKLGEASLAELFNVSRTSVRTTLKQLEADGLVSTEPNKGAWVSLPSDSEIRALFEARRLIEMGIVSELCRRADPLLLRELRLHVQQEGEASGSDYGAFVQLLSEFHLKLAKALNNPVLLRDFRKLIERASLYAATFDDAKQEVCRGNEHTQLLDYIEAGQQAAAIELTCSHLISIEQAILKAAETLKDNYHPLRHLIAG